MYKYLFVAPAILMMASLTGANDLYKISVASEDEAVLLRSLDIKPILRLHDGYLVLVNPSDGEKIKSLTTTPTLAATDIEIAQLALDRRRDRVNAEKYPVVFEQGDVRVLKVDWSAIKGTKQAGQM